MVMCYNTLKGGVYMYCQQCGKEIDRDDAQFCPYCGCPVSLTSMNQNGSYYHPNYGGYPSYVNPNDRSSIGLNILSFFIPIVGLILFIVFRKDSPKKANGCGIGGIAGFIFNTVLLMLL